MKTTLPTRDLRVGMFVELPHAWWQHPFVRGHFVIDSAELLGRVQTFYDGEVTVDIDRSWPPEDPSCNAPESAASTNTAEQATAQASAANTIPISDVASGIHEALCDSIHSPDERATAIFNQSCHLMDIVLQQPNAANIRAAKSVIGETVEAIVADTETADNLISVSQHDFHTYTHSVNVGIYSVALATRLYHDAAEHDLREMGAAFFLHDLGKTRIDPAIINKQGRLNEREMHIMRTHPYYSYDILEETGTATEECHVIALQHHERVDGSGYPLGLRGDEIHEYARICSIADVYDAMVSRRSYKPAMTPFQALSVMRRDMLGHFHREMFEAFVCMLAPRQAA